MMMEAEIKRRISNIIKAKVDLVNVIDWQLARSELRLVIGKLYDEEAKDIGLAASFPSKTFYREAAIEDIINQLFMKEKEK